MSEDKVEFRWLEAKCVGGNVVIFRLEDGTQVKVTVDLDRAGVAINQLAPDGNPMYNLNFSNKANIIPPTKKYTLPKSQLGVSTTPPKDGKAPYG
jgi:hypothetical protein